MNKKIILLPFIILILTGQSYADQHNDYSLLNKSYNRTSILGIIEDVDVGSGAGFEANLTTDFNGSNLYGSLKSSITWRDDVSGIGAYDLNVLTIGAGIGLIIDLGPVHLVPNVQLSHSKLNDFDFWYAKWNTTEIGLDLITQIGENTLLTFTLDNYDVGDINVLNYVVFQMESATAIGGKISTKIAENQHLDLGIKFIEDVTFMSAGISYDF